MAIQPIRPGTTQLIGGAGTSSKSLTVRTTATQVSRINATADQVTDADTLARFLNTLDASMHDATIVARSLPFMGGSLVAGIVAAGGGTKDIAHNLGRRINGIICVRAQGGAWTGYEVSPQPTAIDQTKAVRLNIATAGTFALWFY